MGCDGAWCDLEEGAWYGGELLYTRYDVPSAAACCDACLATPRCVGFNYNRATLSSEDNGAEPLSCALQVVRSSISSKKWDYYLVVAGSSSSSSTSNTSSSSSSRNRSRSG